MTHPETLNPPASSHSRTGAPRHGAPSLRFCGPPSDAGAAAALRRPSRAAASRRPPAFARPYRGRRPLDRRCAATGLRRPPSAGPAPRLWPSLMRRSPGLFPLWLPTPSPAVMSCLGLELTRNSGGARISNLGIPMLEEKNKKSSAQDCGTQSLLVGLARDHRSP